MSCKKSRNCLWFSPLDLITFTACTTGSTICLKSNLDLQRFPWWIIQWNKRTLWSGKSAWILSFILLIRPECFPVNEGAPSVVMRTSLSRHSCDFSNDCITLLNISCPVVVLLKLSMEMDSNSSVMQKSSSITLIKISNCAVSNTSVLSSKAILCAKTKLVFVAASLGGWTLDKGALLLFQLFNHICCLDFQFLCQKLLAKVLMFCYKMSINIIFIEHRTRFITNQAGSFWWTSVYCCNLSGGAALIVWFTTNGMCAKNKNICMWCEQATIEWSRQVISIVAFCHGAKLCAHAIRDFRSQKMVLWPGCGSRAEFSLHTKNVRWVWFVVKRRGCCCNFSGGVALFVWFITNGMCAKNKNICMWHEQAIIEWSRQVISIVAKLCVQSFVHMLLGISDHNTIKKILLCPFLIENTAFRIHFAFLVTQTDGLITGVGKLQQLHSQTLFSYNYISVASFTVKSLRSLIEVYTDLY